MSCEGTLRCLNGVFTGLFLLISLAFIGYGLSSTYILLLTNDTETLTEEYLALSSFLTTVYGILLFVFVILGCCSICRQGPCCLETYSVFILLLAVAQIGTGVFSLVHFNQDNSDKLSKRIETDLTTMSGLYLLSPFDIETAQSTLGCCGVNSEQDWINLRTELPLSCCRELTNPCSISSPTRYQEGCLKQSMYFITGTNLIIGWSLIAVGIFEILAATLGICTSCSFWRSY